jgi:soluble lytic murein transglycosylase-like protein
MIRRLLFALAALVAVASPLRAQSLYEVARAELDGTCGEVVFDRSIASLEEALAAARLARCALDEGAFDLGAAAGLALERWLESSPDALDEAYPWIDDLVAHVALIDGRTAVAEQRFAALADSVGGATSLRQRAFRLYGLGLAREAQGNLEGADAAYRALIQRYPSSELGARVAVRLVGDSTTSVAALERASSALRGRHYAAAQQLLEMAACAHDERCSPRAAMAGGDTAYEAAYQLGFLLYRYRRELVSQALPWLETVAATPGDRRADAAWAYARAVMRLERHDEARRAWADFARRFPDDPRHPDADYEVAWLYLDEDRYDEAAAAFAHFVSSFPSDSRRTAARWFGGWADFRAGELQRALDSWESLGDDAPSMRTQTRYWRAVALEQLGRHEESVELLEAVVSAQPVSWFGALAAQRLGRAIGGAAAGPIAPARSAGSLEQLAEHGMVAETAMLARAGSVDLDDPFVRMRLLASPDDWRIWREAFDPTQLPRDSAALVAARLASPRFYDTLVHENAVSASLPESIVWGVMQRESAFQRGALSVSDAMGLMQVIPQTAERIALALDESYVDGMLFEPRHAIRYGAWYLGALRRHFRGSLPLAVVAYNAGPLVTEGWVEQNAGMPLDEFVEEIVFDQARDYVKKVVSTALAYELAWSTDGQITAARLAELLPPTAPDGWTGEIDF